MKCPKCEKGEIETIKVVDQVIMNDIFSTGLFYPTHLIGSILSCRACGEKFFLETSREILTEIRMKEIREEKDGNVEQG